MINLFNDVIDFKSNLRFDKIGLVYKGSKRKIALSIIDEMINYQKNKFNNFILVDVFGGGGSISFNALLNRRSFFKQIIYNDVNKDIVNIIKFIIDENIDNQKEKKIYKFINPDEFNQLINSSNSSDVYQSIYKYVFSFGGGEKTYLYSTETYTNKTILHNLLFSFDKKTFNDLIEKLEIVIDEENFKKGYRFKTIYERYNYFYQHINNILHNYYNIKLNDYNKYIKKRNYIYLEHITRAYSIIKHNFYKNYFKNKMIILNQDYKDLFKQLKTNYSNKKHLLIYLDPPYYNTANIYFNKFNLDYKEFYETILNNDFNIFISEYELIEEYTPYFKLVKEFKTKNKLSKKYNDKEKTERLFVKIK